MELSQDFALVPVIVNLQVQLPHCVQNSLGSNCLFMFLFSFSVSGTLDLCI
jgi:hypothetical protein